ncbi:MAG: Ig-like domain-containing protein [Clostridia bacterium]|nr:Ig-like domain-containing protein [Clostridia bacterium]
MKKLISGLLVIVVLLTMIPAAAFATATTDEGLIFDLDLTGSTAEGIQVSNSVEGNSTAYYVGAAPSTGTINGRPYLAFRQSKDDSDAIGKYIKIVDAGFKNNDEMTFEFWARPRWMNATDSADFNYRMASMATGGGSTDQNKLDIYSYGRNMYYRPGGENKTTNYEMHSKLWNLNLNGKWTHFVFTRKWEPASAEDTVNGTWTGSVYVNGTKVTPAGTSENATTRAAGSEEGLYFILGNGHYVNNSFVGDIADVKIYNTILTDEQISAKHENSADAYVAFEIEAVSAASTIDVNAGEITVDFSEALNTASVDGITFTKADGTAIKGAYIVSASGDKATVEYGKLEEGASYKLTIPGSVESVSGKNITAAEYTFTAAKTYIVNEDFTGETTVPTIPNITYMSNSIANDTSAMSIKQTSDGDYYLAVNPTTDAKDYKVTYTPSAALDTTMDVDDMHIVEVKLGSELTAKTEGVAARNVARNFMRINGAAIASAGEFWKANMLFYPYDSEGVKGSAHTMSKDSNGFAYIRMVFGTYENSDGSKYLGYEMKDLNDGYSTTFKSSSTFGSAQSVTAFPNKMSSLLFSHIYPLSEDTWTAENRYSDIKVYTRKRTKALKVGEYNSDTKSVALSLNNDLASGEETKIVVTDESNTAVTAAAAYNQVDRTVTLTFADALNGVYTVSLADAVDAEGIACSAKTVSFEVTGGTEADVVYYNGADVLTSLDGATAVKAVATLRNYEGAAPTGILAVYEGKRLVDAVVATSEVSGSTVTYNAEITGLAAMSDATSEVKFFIWDSLSTFVPVVEAEIFVAGGGL